MALYEHVFMARQDISQAHLEGLVETFKGVLETNGGSVGRIEHWGLRTVTYRVKKNRKCYYVLMDITAPAAAVAEMERQMGISEDILRIFTIKVDAHETGPSAMLAKRDRDEDRGERGGDRFDRPRRERPSGDRPDRGPRRPRDEDSESAGA